MPKVSVIIPSYNCVRYLPEALDSVFAQTFQDFEIVILDDGSTDNTKEVVAVYSEKCPNKIKYIFQDNRGLAIARNVAIQNSVGQYIAILDADDAWLPERLKDEVEVLDKHPEVGLVHANIAWMSEEGKQLSEPRRDRRFLSGRIFDHIFLRDAHISISTILLRRECFDRVGLFDENLARLGCEDREMWLRVAMEYKILYLDKVLGLYRVRQGSMSRDRDKMMKARLYVIDKFCPPGNGCSVLRRKALSKLFRDEGDEYLLSGQIKEARGRYLQALRHWPFSFWSIANYLKACFK